MEKLLIVGCGPKAIAIAAKAHALKNLGWQVPEISIIDKTGPAAYWDGSSGYSDGDTILGTTPLEDIGFPYDSPINKSIDTEMLKLSYMAYLVESGQYAEWVDRLLTPPSHRMLADYLKWAFKKIDGRLTIGEVKSIALDNNQWSVTYSSDGGEQTARADGLVMTGAGDAIRFPLTGQPANSAKVLDGQNIWHNIDHFKDLKNAKIAVIGGGETAAGIVTGLLKIIDGSSRIEIITRHPILFTRNENWMEVMYFSKVMDWAELTEQQKREVIKHADRGTFSVAAKNLLDSAYNVSTQLGNVESIDAGADKLSLVLADDAKKRLDGYDYVIEATGFDPRSFIKLFPDKSLFSDEHFPDKIEPDLSVAGVSPKLHVPGLAAMAQGPGFPNLSCLGLLSERVLKPYISK